MEKMSDWFLAQGRVWNVPIKMAAPPPREQMVRINQQGYRTNAAMDEVVKIRQPKRESGVARKCAGCDKPAKADRDTCGNPACISSARAAGSLNRETFGGNKKSGPRTGRTPEGIGPCLEGHQHDWRRGGVKYGVPRARCRLCGMNRKRDVVPCQ